MGKVAIGRLVLTSREHIIALEPMKRGLMGLLLRDPYEIRNEDEYFDGIQDVKVTKEMLDRSTSSNRNPESSIPRSSKIAMRPPSPT